MKNLHHCARQWQAQTGVEDPNCGYCKRFEKGYLGRQRDDSHVPLPIWDLIRLRSQEHLVRQRQTKSLDGLDGA
jgi:hypothetical protein